MKYRQVALLSFFISLNVFADTANWNFIKTPRGTDLEIKITKSLKVNAPLLVVAPGQSCNSKGPLFDTIEQVAIKKEINIVRFEWSYCAPASINKNPSDDLSAEISDMNLAIDYSKDLLHKTDDDLLVSGKSLGSIVAFQVFKNHSDLKSLTLLTPVCSYLTDDQGNPLPAPMDVINENYSGLLLEKRSVFMISGNNDPLCNHAILNNFKNKVGLNFEVKYVEGNHSFTILNADGSINPIESQNNLQNVSDSMIQWFSLFSEKR
jgi:alpha/beta superfamily hydrolase